MEFMDYFLTVVAAYVIILNVLRIFNLFFKPKILQNHRFQFPTEKWDLAFYCLCAIVVMVLGVMLKLKLI